MNGQKYLALLKEKLDQHMTIHRSTIFMHDGAPCYRAKVNYLDQKNIERLEWPGNSPDLNPIENLWSVMKQKVSEKQPSSLQALKKNIMEVWTQEFSKEYCQDLIASIPRRLQAVVDNNEGKY